MLPVGSKNRSPTTMPSSGRGYVLKAGRFQAHVVGHALTLLGSEQNAEIACHGGRRAQMCIESILIETRHYAHMNACILILSCFNDNVVPMHICAWQPP